MAKVLLGEKMIAKVSILTILCFYVVSISNHDVAMALLRVTKA